MKHFFSILSLAIILAIAILYGDLLTHPASSATAKMISTIAPPLVKKIQPTHSPSFGDGLKRTVETALQGKEGVYGVVVINLKTGESYLRKEDYPFATASLYKLWVMGTVFDQVKKGHMELNQVISADAKTITQATSLSEDNPELPDTAISATIEQALYKMITISDNQSAWLLSSTVQLSNVATFMQENGLLLSNLGDPPEATPSDIALFYKKLYEKKIIDPEYSVKMMDLLKQQQINDRIPKYLPSTIVVAHKTGELYGFKHDAGIVFAPFGDYIIILMSNTSAPAVAAENEAKISQAVYEYFANETK